MGFDVGIPEPCSEERELLLRFLWRKRSEVAATADGLSDEQARWTPAGSLMLPIVGIINHLTQVEWRWINGRYLCEPFPPRREEFRFTEDRTLDEVVEAYWQRGEATDAVVHAAPGLEAPCLGCEGEGPPLHVVLGVTEPVDLRWALLHLIEETAHHAGHADSTRELLDGRRMT